MTDEEWVRELVRAIDHIRDKQRTLADAIKDAGDLADRAWEIFEDKKEET